VSAAVVALGMAFGAGLVLIAVGLRPRRPAAPDRRLLARGRWRPARWPTAERFLPVAIAGLVTLIVTRWPVLAVAAGVAVWWLSAREHRIRAREIEATEAIATWAEMLRDATGTPRGIEGVLVSTASTAPRPIRQHVTRLAHRVTYEPLELALAELADDLDDPNGDLVVAALELAATSGGRDLRAVLDSLATSARDEARMRRRIEVSRERPRSDMRQVVVIIVAVIVLLSVIARGYLASYSTVGGQLVLAVAAAFWIGGFAAMARLGRVAPVRRFLTHREPA